MQADSYLFNAIRKHAGRHGFLDNLGRFCADYPAYAMVAVVAIIALYARNWQLFFMPLFAGLVARFVINEAIYLFYKRKRPSEVLGFTPLIKKPKHPSFPSGHAAFFGGVSFMLLAYGIPLGLVCIAVTLAVLMARVFCGVHWPSDIVAGLVVAALSALSVWYLL